MSEQDPSPSFSRMPILWLAGAFAIGILAASAAEDGVVGLGVLALTAALAAFVLRNYSAATYLALAAFAAAGALSAAVEKRSVSPDRIRVLYDTGVIRSGDPVEIEGVLASRPEPAPQGSFLTIRSERLVYQGAQREVSGNVRIFVPTSDTQPPDSEFEISDAKYGSRLRVACQLKREDQYLNPGVTPRREILDRLGIDATASVKSALLIEHIADESVFVPLAWVYDQRAELIDIFRTNLSPSASGVMNASLLGDKHFLDKETADVFREGGAFHILVISGLHITFIGGLVLMALKQFTRNRWILFLVTASILWLYTLAVGADVPVVRAAIMFTIIVCSYVLYREASLLNALGICCLVLLVWRPSDLFNPSFQLTFVSIAAILAMAYPIIVRLREIGEWTPSTAKPFPPRVPDQLRRSCETLYWREPVWKIESNRQLWGAELFKAPFWPLRIRGIPQRLLRYIFEGVLVSVIVQIWMLPLLVIHFHRVSVASVVLNLWVGFFIALESFAAVVGAGLYELSGLVAAPFFLFAELFNSLMLAVPKVVSATGWAGFRLPAYSGRGWIVYILYCVPLILFAVALHRWNPFDIRGWDPGKPIYIVPMGFAVFILSGAIILFHPFSLPVPDGRLHIDFLDVGQGDSALVTFPNGETLLVDGGGRVGYGGEEDVGPEPFEPDVTGIGERVVSEYLWHRGYSSIDHILATHADADHIQGLTDVARNFSIRSALVARRPAGDPDFVDLWAVLHRRGIPIQMVSRGDRLQFGDAHVEVLHPGPVVGDTTRSGNSDSLVLRIVYGNRAFLLTGDIEAQAEKEVVYHSGTLRADLVKVAHHGSRTSSTAEFVNSVQPEYAVIPVGRSSPFGHPHPEVVERWKAAGAKLITTGEMGTISVSTDGRDIVIRTLNSEKQ